MCYSSKLWWVILRDEDLKIACVTGLKNNDIEESQIASDLEKIGRRIGIQTVPQQKYPNLEDVENMINAEGIYKITKDFPY